MPFTPENIFRPNPDVRVFFTGLMLIRPSMNSNTCEVWVHRAAAEHELTVEVREKRPGRPDVIRMRKVGPLPYAFPPIGAAAGDPPIHGLILQVRQAPKGVRAYTGADTANGEEALTEAVNFQSFHNGRVAPDVPNGEPGLNALNGRPSILMNDGLFYSAVKTPSDTTIELERDGAATIRLDPISSVIGANIYLDTADQLLVRWGDQGRLKQLPLDKPAANSGISYEIYIINDPLFEDENRARPVHDEFEEYYKLLREVPASGLPKPFRTQDQFRLKITPPGGNPHRGSTVIPCMSALIDP